VFLDEFLVYALFNSLNFVKYGNKKYISFILWNKIGICIAHAKRKVGNS
jgi:hypothetical protein